MCEQCREQKVAACSLLIENVKCFEITRKTHKIIVISLVNEEERREDFKSEAIVFERID